MKKTLKINGMHCTSCSMLIEDNLKGFSGVKSVEASFKKGTAVVEFDEKRISEDTIKEVIERDGYEVE